MPRLTFASLTADLAEQNISLTGKTGAYTVVLPNGYSTTHKTLMIAYDFVCLVKEGLTEYRLKISQLEAVDAYKTYVGVFAVDADVEVTKQFAEVQSTRVNQLASFYQSTSNEDLDWLDPKNSMSQDEEEIGAQLVHEADERRELKQDTVETIELIKSLPVICRGFSTNTRRVSKQLQRRANSFYSLLLETQTPNTRHNFA